MKNCLNFTLTDTSEFSSYLVPNFEMSFLLVLEKELLLIQTAVFNKKHK